VYSGVQVVFTVVFSFLFLGHPVGWDRAAGSAVTVFGVYLVSRAKFSERKPTRKRTENVATDNDATNVSSNAHDDIPLRRVELRRISVDYIAVTVELAR
jgi:drug/metabolite transporter (DMT)-like permease